MNKKIAVIFGGCSSEYDVSLQSSYSVLSNIDKTKYDVIPIGITRQGDWFRYYGSYDKLTDDTYDGICQEFRKKQSQKVLLNVIPAIKKKLRVFRTNLGILDM